MLPRSGWHTVTIAWKYHRSCGRPTQQWRKGKQNRIDFLFFSFNLKRRRQKAKIRQPRISASLSLEKKNSAQCSFYSLLSFQKPSLFLRWLAMAAAAVTAAAAAIGAEKDPKVQIHGYGFQGLRSAGSIQVGRSVRASLVPPSSSSSVITAVATVRFFIRLHKVWSFWSEKEIFFSVPFFSYFPLFFYVFVFGLCMTTAKNVSVTRCLRSVEWGCY